MPFQRPGSIIPLITDIEVREDTVTYRIHPLLRRDTNDRYSRHPFVKDLRLRYPGLALSRVPEHILLVPLLFCAGTTVWKLGLRVRVRGADRLTVASLRALQHKYREIWPEEDWKGEIIFEDIVDVQPPSRPDANRACLLYSGGADSTATLLRHPHKDLTLCALFGHEMPTGKKEQEVSERFRAFSDLRGCGYQPVEFNASEFTNQALCEDSFHGWIDYWWTAQHGPSQSSLLAIPMYLNGASEGYIAATDSSECLGKRGSRPDLDSLVRWSGGRIVHDGAELTRLDKIRMIVEHGRSTGEGFTHLRVCSEARALAHLDDAARNCGACQKCLLTQMQLLGLGVPFGEFPLYGFKAAEDARDLLDRLTANFRKAYNRIDDQYDWETLQSIAHKTPGAVPPQIREWLLGMNFHEIIRRNVAAKMEPQMKRREMRRKFQKGPRRILRHVWRRITGAEGPARSAFQRSPMNTTRPPVCGGTAERSRFP